MFKHPFYKQSNFSQFYLKYSVYFETTDKYEIPIKKILGMFLLFYCLYRKINITFSSANGLQLRNQREAVLVAQVHLLIGRTHFSSVKRGK